MPAKKQYVITLHLCGQPWWWLCLHRKTNDYDWSKDESRAVVFEGKAEADRVRKHVAENGHLTEWDRRELYVEVAA